MADAADGHRVRLPSEDNVEEDDLAKRRERIADIASTQASLVATC